jgi:hypothetical protein
MTNEEHFVGVAFSEKLRTDGPQVRRMDILQLLLVFNFRNIQMQNCVTRAKSYIKFAKLTQGNQV